MAERKSRARSREQKSKPSLNWDPEHVEEIAALGTLVLAAFTALGAFDLSGGFLLTSWVEFLQMLLGWGVYAAPLLLAALGVWLLLDALDRIVDMGWERPIGLALGYLTLLAILHWLGTPTNLTQRPGPFHGGGLVGWALSFVLLQAFGIMGSAVALAAVAGIALVLLFNLSPSDLIRRALDSLRFIPRWRLGFPHRGFPRPNHRFPETRSGTPPSYIQPLRTPVQLPLPPPISRRDENQVEEQETAPEPEAPAAGHVTGSDSVPAAPSAPVALSAPLISPLIQREWELPDYTEILEESPEQEVSAQEIRTKVHMIEETLAHFGVPAKVIEVNQGPTITQFGVEPGFLEQKGGNGQMHRVKVKVSRISSLQHDLELALAAAPIRIEAPVPGRGVVGIEVPNSQVSLVSLRSVVESEAFGKIKSKLKIALGQDVAGQPICDDLTKMPHLLIAGATGSGKSVCLNSIIAALLCTTTPAEVQFVMIDPKRVELVNLNDIPHLARPVVVDVQNAVAVLQCAVEEMDRRFKLFAEMHVRNVEAYNEKVARLDEEAASGVAGARVDGAVAKEKLPFLVVIVDELADLMIVAAGEVEHAITRLAQMARATGIHLILATQRPSVNVVTGLIKANFPARISFAVTSQTDSRVVLDSPGAEELLGRGDMLYMPSDSSKLVRLQGCYVSDRELEKLVDYWKALAPPRAPEPELGRTESPAPQRLSSPSAAQTKSPSEDDLLPQAIEVVNQNKKASVSLLQRKLRIGYSRASRLMELLEEKGIVGPDEGPTKGRSVRMVSETILPEPNTPAPGAKDDFADWNEEDWKDLDKD